MRECGNAGMEEWASEFVHSHIRQFPHFAIQSFLGNWSGLSVKTASTPSV